MLRRTDRASSLHIGQLSVARRSAIARGWANQSRDVGEAAVKPEVIPGLVRPRIPISPNSDPDAVRTFAYQVALATMGPVLRYSQRLQLLASANRAGIARFDANLIIAAIENHRGSIRQVKPIPMPTTTTEGSRSAVFTAICVQAGLIALTWAALVF